MSIVKDQNGCGDIWSTGEFVCESPLKDLLDSGEYTLEQLLREDELLQELKGLGHPQLVEYMCARETVQGLVHYISTDCHSLLSHSSKSNKKSGKRRKRRASRNGIGVVSTSTTTIDTTSDDEYESLSAKLNNRLGFLGANPEYTDDYNNISSKSLCSINLTEDDPNTNNDNVTSPTEEDEEEEEVTLNSVSPYEQQMKCIRYPYIACEVICCEISSIIDTLVDSYVDTDMQDDDVDSCASNDGSHDEEGGLKSEVKKKRMSLLDLLFSLLDQEPGNMDDRLGGYFEKVLMVLFRHRPTSLGSYINSGGLTLFHKFIGHIYNHSIMQILLKLLLPPPPPPPCTNNEEPGTFAYNTTTELEEDSFHENDFQRALKCSWYTSPGTLSLLVKKLAVDMSEDENIWIGSHHSSQLLISLIQNSTLDSSFLKTLTGDADIFRSIVERATTVREGEEFVQYESPMTYSMNVLEVILLQLAGYGNIPIELMKVDGDQANINIVLQLLPSVLNSLSSLLQHPVTETWKTVTTINIRPMLGASRLRIIKLIEAVILSDDTAMDEELGKSDVLQQCLELFWQMEFCSMLHQSVANVIVIVMEGGDRRAILQEYFINRCNLLEKCVDAFSLSNTSIDKRPGYMGHVIVICQAIELVYSSTKCQVKLQQQRSKQMENKIENSEPDAVEENNDTQQPSIPISTELVSMMEKQTFHPKWCAFVSTTLSQEISLQSTPLGVIPHHHHTSEEHHPSDVLELNDTDLDVAASLMDSLRISSTERKTKIVASEDDEDEQPGVVTKFGTTVDLSNRCKQGDYYYDDPLGSKKVVFSLEEDDADDGSSSDEDNDDDKESSVPVMDLFAGNFPNSIPFEAPPAMDNYDFEQKTNTTSNNNTNSGHSEFLFDADFSCFSQQDEDIFNTLKDGINNNSSVQDPFGSTNPTSKNIDDLFSFD